VSRVNLVYAMYNEIRLNSGPYMTDLTWIIEEAGSEDRKSHHYFVDYPGVKEIERQTAQVVGGRPLVRYSVNTVLKAFSGDVPPRAVLVMEDERNKERFKTYLNAANVNVAAPMTVLEDAVLFEDDRNEIYDLVRQIRIEAASRFGSSL
jgi:hypothetical protein